MAGRPRLPWSRKREEQPQPAQAAPSPLPAPAAAAMRPVAPIPRAPDTRAHHWLALLVARHGPAGPVPVPGARVIVRAFPRGATRPGAPVGRGTTNAEGTLTLLLPEGRYAVSATSDGDARIVTVTLEHAGRATLVLESLQARVMLRIEATRSDGEPLAQARVEVRAAAGNALVVDGTTDEAGHLSVTVPRGAYEVRAGAARVRTYVEAATTLRITADDDAPAGASGSDARPAPSQLSPYAQRIRHATHYAAPYQVHNVRDEGWN